MNAIIASLPILFLLDAGPDDASGSWRQFRGPSGAVAVDNKVLPTEIGPKQYVVWKTPLPKGHSSPIIDGERIFLTGIADQKLVTIGLDRATGKELWRAVAPHKILEKLHAIG